LYHQSIAWIFLCVFYATLSLLVFLFSLFLLLALSVCPLESGGAHAWGGLNVKGVNERGVVSRWSNFVHHAMVLEGPSSIGNGNGHGGRGGRKEGRGIDKDEWLNSCDFL